MTNQQRILVALVFVVAVVGGGALAVALFGGDGGSGAGASPSPIAVATASPVPASPVPSESAPASEPPSPSAVPSASPPASPTTAPTPSPSPTPTPTAGPGEPTVVVLTALKLDAKDDPAGLNRRISFRSQGAGTITVAVRTLSPQGSTIACLSADGDRVACKTSGATTITADTSARRADFLLTLRGDGIEAPVIEVTITFPARNPSITIENARFDGTLFPETNGLQLFVSPREAGDVTIEATWGGKPFNYEIDLFEQGGPGSQVLANQGPSTGTEASLPVTPGNPWKLLLQNVNEGFGVTGLDATIGWP